MSRTDLSGPLVVTAGLAIPDVMGIAGTYSQLVGQTTAIAQASATTLFTITVPNVTCGAGGRVLCSSVITQASHLGDSTRTIEYVFSVTRVIGAAAVMTISIVTGGTVIATSSAGYTLTSTIAAASVSGANTATQTFAIQITNTGSTSSTTNATWIVELLNNTGSVAAGTSSVPAPGVTIA